MADYVCFIASYRLCGMPHLAAASAGSVAGRMQTVGVAVDAWAVVPGRAVGHLAALEDASPLRRSQSASADSVAVHQVGTTHIRDPTVRNCRFECAVIEGPDAECPGASRETELGSKTWRRRDHRFGPDAGESGSQAHDNGFGAESKTQRVIVQPKFRQCVQPEASTKRAAQNQLGALEKHVHVARSTVCFGLSRCLPPRHAAPILAMSLATAARTISSVRYRQNLPPLFRIRRPAFRKTLRCSDTVAAERSDNAASSPAAFS